MSYKDDFLDVMEKSAELASDFGISKEELENAIMAFSQPSSEDVSILTEELIDKINSIDNDSWSLLGSIRPSGVIGEGYLRGKKINIYIK